MDESFSVMAFSGSASLALSKHIDHWAVKVRESEYIKPETLDLRTDLSRANLMT